jgi:hypothetical protein
MSPAEEAKKRAEIEFAALDAELEAGTEAERVQREDSLPNSGTLEDW